MNVIIKLYSIEAFKKIGVGLLKLNCTIAAKKEDSYYLIEADFDEPVTITWDENYGYRIFTEDETFEFYASSVRI